MRKGRSCRIDLLQGSSKISLWLSHRNFSIQVAALYLEETIYLIFKEQLKLLGLCASVPPSEQNAHD